MWRRCWKIICSAADARSLRRDLLLVVALLAVVACERGSTTLELTGSTMGTSYSIALVDPPATLDLDALEQDIDSHLAEITARMSTYEPDSELSQFNSLNSSNWQPVSRELCEAIRDAVALSAATNGAFDITVGPVVDLWGFGPGGSRTTVPSAADIEAAMQSVGYDKIETNCAAPAVRKRSPALRIDLSAYGKGLAVDGIARLLEQSALRNYLVEIGGELRARGVNGSGQAWRVAIERPVADERSVQRVLSIDDKAVATSGDYRNFFVADGQRYSHTIDPQTGAPVTHQLAAVTVVAASAARADALATALLVLGPVEGLQYAVDHGVAALFLVHRQDNIEAIESPAFTELSTR